MMLLMPKNLSEEIIREVIAKNDGKGFAVKNIPIEDYHRGPGISSSDIKALVTGTIEQWLYDKANPKAPTPALVLGNAIHTMTLEPEDFWNRYSLEEDAPKAPARSTKEGKEAWREYLSAHDLVEGEVTMDPDDWKSEWLKWKHPKFNKIIISKDDVIICNGIRLSIERHPMVSQIFKDGDSEVTLYWIDEETDTLCKCRPDRLNQTFPCIPDLKSTQSAALDDFEHDITTHLYHVSAWWYLWGAKKVFDKDFENFVYVPCEKTEPFQVTFYTADEGSLSVGEGLCRAGLAIYKRFKNATKDGVTTPHGIWAGYSLEPKSAGIRPYGFNKLSQVIHAQDLYGMGLEKFVGVT